MTGETQKSALAKPIFREFDSHGVAHIYRRHLPHWRQDGPTYFATFRLGDSIPRHVLLAWHEEDVTWLRAQGIDGPLSDPKWRFVYEPAARGAGTSEGITVFLESVDDYGDDYGGRLLLRSPRNP